MDLNQMENIITSQLSVRVPKILDGKYPSISFTNQLTDETPKFPNVYIHELEPSEVGNSIPNQVIHAIRDTFQIDVTTNTTKTDARTVTNACILAIKRLGFSVVTFPIYTKDNNLHRFIFRARRVIANGDTF